MCPEERRRRNIKTCCVSLEMAVADMMYFFFSFERELCFCVSLERELCFFFFFFCFSCVFFFVFFFFVFNVQIQRELWEAVWSWFLEPCDWTAVRTVPHILDIDRFLSIKEPWLWERFMGFPVGPYDSVWISKPWWQMGGLGHKWDRWIITYLFIYDPFLYKSISHYLLNLFN